MSTSPLVSVLIRTRNRKALLLETLHSVLQQHWQALEILIINDRGEDFSGDLPQVTAPRTLSWHDNQGQGRSAAANTALNLATGQYCLFLDDDDWLDPEHISTLLKALQQQSTCLVAYSDTATHQSDGTIDTSSFTSAYDHLRLLVENYIPIHAVLFARSLLEHGCRFDLNFDCYEDWDFWLQIASHSDFLHVPGATAHYRIAAGSGFGATRESTTNRAALYRKWLKLWSEDQLLAVMDRARASRITASLRQELTEQVAFVKHLQSYEQERENLIAELRTELAILNADFQHAQFRLEGQKAISKALRHDLEVMTNSRSWRLTKPLRQLNKLAYYFRTEGLRGIVQRLQYRLLHPTPVLPHSQSHMPLPEGYHPLEFPAHEQPLVSIVIPVYNKYEYSFHCLKSVLANSGDVAYEVIVVDDCSADETPQMLEQIRNITVLRNAKNGGFIYSCNAGAQAARGTYLLMLNNDTEPQPGWLQALLKTFSDFPDAGMVGAKLLYPDGSLQEAGGIVWQDGSAWNYGRQDDENRPEYSYARNVDYCSGACLLLLRDTYMALGMFDTLYTPAYYEDTDLAFKIAASGKQMIYQPQARVIHYEGISNGTDLNGGGIKEYQRVNHAKFVARWQEVLATHAPNGQQPELERDRGVSKRVLIVDAQVLMPDRDSGSLRMFNFIKVFQRLGYKVTFIPDNLQYREIYTPMLQALGVECHYSPYLTSVEQHVMDAGLQYDVVVLSRADFAEKHIDAVLQYCPRAQVWFDTVDLHFLRESRAAELNQDAALQASAEQRKVQELGIARKAHQTLVVSPVEVELFRQEAPDVKVALISNIHAVQGRQKDYAERENILFIGSFDHPPNIDAMHFFIDEIFPLIHARKPDLKVLIVGGSAPRSLQAKGNQHLVFTGFVADIEPLFTNIRLSIAPLRYGAGVKGKINSSMTYGVPVIASTIAAEGMGLMHGEDVLIADAPADFADAVLQVYDDEALWTRLSDAGLANISRCFSFEVAQQQLSAILADHQPL